MKRKLHLNSYCVTKICSENKDESAKVDNNSERKDGDTKVESVNHREEWGMR